MSTVNSLVTVDPLELDAKDLFSHLPANRVGEADRRYMQELFEDGFGNRESAGMLGRFESAFAARFGMP